MFLKETLRFNTPAFLLFIILLGGCSLNLGDSLSNGNGYNPQQPDYLSRLLVPNQLPAPPSIQSIELYRKGSPGNPPVIEMDSRQKLILRFDELSDLSGQFRVTFSHRDLNWDDSNIPSHWYMEGNNELIINGGTKNALHEPDYFNYELEIPGDRMQFTASGNYMLHVYDYSSNTELFSLPFFVTEDEGNLSSRAETQFNSGKRGRPADQPFSEYRYPEFVEFPQFDLEFFFVQNRFWGSSRQTDIFDVATPGQVNFHLPRDNSFAANFDFNGLNVLQYEQDGQIIEWFPANTPPLAILREDVLNFSSDPVASWRSSFGNPEHSRSARYAQVRFRFYDGGNFNTEQGVYLTGDFNQWVFKDQYKLQYNPDSGYWETTALIKNGTYTYKYATKSGDSINDLILSDALTRNRQEYMSFVYFKDPEYGYYRLLNADRFYSR